MPLWRATAKAIRAWLRLNADLGPGSALLPNLSAEEMTRSNVTQRLALAVKTASITTPCLAKRSISPHTLLHTTAMHLLQSGVDINVIALWLGHESPTTTHQYVEADLAMKEKALGRLQDPRRRYVASGRRTHCWSSSRRFDYVQNLVAESSPITRKTRRPWRAGTERQVARAGGAARGRGARAGCATRRLRGELCAPPPGRRQPLEVPCDQLLQALG